ncbi:MAG: histidinol-phosphatase HisJ family protein [Oscillospiraceae bacterium]
MELTKLTDLHTHTSFSPDSSEDIYNMCARAAELGLAAYAVTDHCECNTWYEKRRYSVEQLKGFSQRYAHLYAFGFKDTYEKSVTETLRMKELFDGRLNLLCGIELGQATADTEAADYVAADKRLDFVIGSMHQLPGWDDFAFINFSRMSDKKIQFLAGKYFEEVLKLCQWGKFDVLGHLTYILRYIEGKYKRTVNMAAFEELIRAIFSAVIARGKGIEINTSGLRQSYGRTFPDIALVRLYRSMGGEILTIGSDAHCVPDLGKGIEQGAALAKEAGFRFLTYFKNRKPEFLRIP